MADMTAKDCKVFMCMPCSFWVCFLNQLLPANSGQLRAQDFNTTVAGSEGGTITHAEGEEDVDSIFAETEDLHDWTNNIVLKTSSSSLATPSALLCACCNSEELPSAYPAIINWFKVSHHKETLYVYVQALFVKDNTVTPIQLRAYYHSSYDVEQLVEEVVLFLHVTTRDTSGFSLQHVYTITHCNQYPANSELPHTLGLDLQANTPCFFSLALRLFVQAVKDNNPQLHLPLAVSVTHFMWYPPKVCSSGTVGFAGRCLEHFCGPAYQSKVSLPACYSYMEDVLIDCLTIESAFSDCGGWGRLVSEGNLHLPLCSWTGMSCNSQLA
ncbi:hypothetical protein DSO57_1009167 [Entomophthora muscae]|uniref:Uncharacterized protein n=1 Tax=Entomophthora muscae TaxID=34485 RepID=A0ACC2T6V1_9FUNG|nr:hypothetical protein DSO57_1009167 [Entomophthora muscae]